MSDTRFRVCTVEEGVILIEADTVLFRNGGIQLLSNGVFRAQFKNFVYFTASGGQRVQVLEDPALSPLPTVEPARVRACHPPAVFWLISFALGSALGLMLSDLVKAFQ